MRALIQRVEKTELTVEGVHMDGTAHGMCIFLGIGKEDTDELIRPLIDKIMRLRIFEDDDGKMNRTIEDSGGSMLIVSQFTLFADTRKGNRPSFTDAAPPEKAIALYEDFIRQMKEQFSSHVATGVFGADMKVELVNDGPVTILLDTDHWNRGG